jgi:predicted outer membrane protein
MTPARAALLAVLAAACASTAGPGVGELVAEPSAECRKVGEVEGSGVAWKLNPVEQQRSVARAEAMDRAKKMGATHVRFVDERSDAQGTFVQGVAYACP